MPAPMSLGGPPAAPPLPSLAPVNPPPPPTSPLAEGLAPGAGAGDPYSQTNTATLIMGGTGSGKSSLLATLARYLARFHKVLLLYVSDGGGYPMEVQKEIAVGRIRLWRMYTRDPGNLLQLAWDTMLHASMGWWPLEINPLTGESPVGVKLQPPVATMFTMLCPNGHIVKQTTKSQELVASVCPFCHALVSDTNMRVERVVRRPTFFEDVGAVAYDGLSSMCAWGEADLGDRAGRQDLAGVEGAIGGKVISGDFKLGQVTMSHIGFSQQQARAIVLNTQSIPHLVVPPVFTALTLDASVEGTRVCGPELSGKKKTPVAPQWFGNVLEPERRELGPDRYQFRLWLTQWKDSEGVIHLCKNRASPGVLPNYIEDPPLTNSQKDEETAFTTFSLGHFFSMLDAGLRRGVEAELAKSGRAMVENKLVKYEDPFADVTPTPAAMPTLPMGPAIAGGGPGPVVLGGPVPIPSAAIPNALIPPVTQPVAGSVAPPPSVAAPPTIAPPPGRRMAPPTAAPVPPPPPPSTSTP